MLRSILFEYIIYKIHWLTLNIGTTPIYAFSYNQGTYLNIVKHFFLLHKMHILANILKFLIHVIDRYYKYSGEKETKKLPDQW